MTNKSFAIDIAEYFMDFLETDFHKRRMPKRACKSTNEKQLLVGINLKDFPKFKKKILKSAYENFKKPENRNLEIKKGIHTVPIPPLTFDIVKEYCKNLKQEELDKVDKEVKALSKELFLKFTSKPEDAKDQILKASLKTVQQILNPLTNRLRDLSDIENDLRDLFHEPIESLVHELVVKNSSESKNTNLDISSVLSLKTIRSEIQNYFETLKITDLFFKVGELLNNEKIIDKQELYIYLYDIKFENITYPLFYIPVEAEKTDESINLKIDSSIYINKKAIEYVIQKINESDSRKGQITGANQRIIYLNEEDIGAKLAKLFNEILNHSKIDKNFDISITSRDQIFKSTLNNISLTNNCYLALFDKSDEALINDYEELINLLKNDSDTGEKFCNLLEGFLKEEPNSIIDEIEREWQNTETSEKLTTTSPIPLNEEQNQIIRAIKKGVKYITVEGPPGTGKSHTITAIVFQAILKNKNILVLSDKKEALDVVEGKITQTLNKVRQEDDFQNPILRLGKTGNTYNKIFSSPYISKIRRHHNQYQKNKNNLESDIDQTKTRLKNSINQEITQYSEIKLSEIISLEKLKCDLKIKNLLKINKKDLFNKECNIIDKLEKMQAISNDFYNLNDSPLYDLCKKILKEPQETESFLQLKKFSEIIDDLKKTELYYNSFQNIEGIHSQNINKLISISKELKSMRNRIFSYCFKGGKLKKLYNDLIMDFHIPFDNLKSEKNRNILNEIARLIKWFEDKQPKIDWSFFRKDKYKVLKESLSEDLNIDDISKIYKDLKHVEKFIEIFPETSESLNLKKGFDVSRLRNIPFKKIISFYESEKKITLLFKNLIQYDYIKSRTKCEDLHKTQMAYIMDKRVINFYNNSPAKTKDLKEIIKFKKKFPKEEFEHLKKAFPCIISGIRDYAEYIPLLDKLFDIVIIDEASQVSIAQALPAVLRAKTTIVFGDKKQFSNIKSSHARSEINKQYIKRIQDNYKSRKSVGESEWGRLLKFDIKTSVLDFFDYIRNYSIMLKKHFRGYRELISYSSEKFYNNELQAIKIRSKKIEHLLEFIFIEHDGKLEENENTNLLEVNKIIEYLERIADSSDVPSIGIITPHTNQQKILFNKINEHPRSNDFYKKNKLKIMTFDTCQGEERDHILYSMVANPESDKLNYIFIKDLQKIDIEEDNIKAQRLNVGFSRAKEKMVFICSQDLNRFSGEIGNALRHYDSIIKQSQKLPTQKDTDKNSPMEKKVLDWLQQTSFFNENQSKIELEPQFKIGEYLKQLDHSYNHPRYICDFLLIYSNDKNRSHKIIIEYDGFEHHFRDHVNVNEYNYEQYYKEEDIYRNKILEGYGYKILRINRFNLGDNPIETLDNRLRFLIQNS